MPISLMIASVGSGILGVTMLLSQGFLLTGLVGLLGGIAAAVMAALDPVLRRRCRIAASNAGSNLELMLGSETLTHLIRPEAELGTSHGLGASALGHGWGWRLRTAETLPSYRIE